MHSMGTAQPIASAAPVETAPAVGAPRAAAPGLLLPALSLAKRELVRFLRQRNRVIGAFATPILFWLLIGGGMGRSFSAEGTPGGDNYLQYLFPGTVLMILLFTAIFSTISIIEDRREGFLQSVLVAPVSRLSIVLGKVLGGAALAWGQGALFLLLGPVVGVWPTFAGAVIALALMGLIAFALTALGFCIAWRMTSTQGFHAVMNLFLMPMWFLSGALFPPDNAATPLRLVMWVNPLTWGLGGLRRAMFLGQGDASAPVAIGAAFVVTVAFAGLLLVMAAGMARAPTAADLQ